MTDKRKAALRRRRLFLTLCALILVAVIAVILITVSSIKKAANGNNDENSSYESGTESSKPVENKKTDPYAEPDPVVRGDYTLDANYSRLLLVNAEYPLPQDYDYGWNLTKIEEKYHNGQLDQIDAGVWPYMKAMIEAAWKDGVKLYVWSPYRSYDTQKMLFENRVKKEGGDEAKAATAVARPGTSEHNTGLCADFNMASSKFESTEMFTWMREHAEEYGFILRYPQDRIDITGVMYESWHWRFVGINRAKEINNLNVTLEEYIKLKGLDPQNGLYEK
ncbi:MAG: M15 family metallopeptidase [Clostridia bacterium]|nr:M15 family metallopeptidase [Clostridia bacterium]